MMPVFNLFNLDNNSNFFVAATWGGASAHAVLFSTHVAIAGQVGLLSRGGLDVFD